MNCSQLICWKYKHAITWKTKFSSKNKYNLQPLRPVRTASSAELKCNQSKLFKLHSIRILARIVSCSDYIHCSEQTFHHSIFKLAYAYVFWAIKYISVLTLFCLLCEFLISWYYTSWLEIIFHPKEMLWVYLKWLL